MSVWLARRSGRLPRCREADRPMAFRVEAPICFSNESQKATYHYERTSAPATGFRLQTAAREARDGGDDRGDGGGGARCRRWRLCLRFTEWTSVRASSCTHTPRLAATRAPFVCAKTAPAPPRSSRAPPPSSGPARTRWATSCATPRRRCARRTTRDATTRHTPRPGRDHPGDRRRRGGRRPRARGPGRRATRREARQHHRRHNRCGASEPGSLGDLHERHGGRTGGGNARAGVARAARRRNAKRWTDGPARLPEPTRRAPSLTSPKPRSDEDEPARRAGRGGDGGERVAFVAAE